MPESLVAIIVALIGGGFTLIGVIISNSRTVAVMNERIEQIRDDQKELKAQQEKNADEIHSVKNVVTGHGEAISALTKRVDTLDRNMISSIK